MNETVSVKRRIPLLRRSAASDSAGVAPSPARPGSRREQEFAELRELMVRAVRRVCPAWLESQREDLVQRAVLKLVEIVAREEREFNRTFVSRVAHSVLVDEIRWRRVRREESLESESGAEPSDPRASTPEQLAASQELGSAIRECLGRLPEDRRLAVTLRLRGHSVPEAAEYLGWSRKRTENLVYRGMADLREHLAARGIEP